MKNLRLRSMVLAMAFGATALFVLAAPPPAEAGEFELGANIGFIDFDGDIADDTELRVDARAGYYWRRGWGLELQAIRATSDFDTELTTVMVNLVAAWRTDRRLNPYTMVGIGQADLELDRPGFNDLSDDSFAFQVGVGLMFEIGERDGLRGRVELSLLTEDTFGGHSTNLGLVGGLAWRFGGNR